MGLLDGKVILITGAGNGLGRAYALAAAREGAKIVVNDLGGSRDGSGGGHSAADAVVAEVVALGSEAVANHDSVTDKAGCARMVQAALDAWGRLDGVVNNAGILRDITFRRMDDAQWAAVMDVHLNGTYNVTRAAVEALAASGGGAIVNTTSYSGLIGNFGQSNYGAAKGGIYAFTRVLSLELRKANIRANCLAPIARTRMTEDIAMVDAEWTPEHVAPMMVFLCSDLARNVTGKVFGVQGNRMHVYEVKVNDGVEKPGAEPWTAAEIAEKLDAICSFDPPALAPAAAPAGPSLVDLAFQRVPGAFMPEKAGDFKATIHFVIKDGPGKTIQIADGKAWVEDGLKGAASATVKTDTETVVGLMNNTVDAAKAFMKGRITADNMGVLMKFATIFRFDGASSASAPPPAVSVAAPAAPAVTAPKARVWPIGKVYQGGYALVDPALVLAYGEATNDSHVAYVGPDGVAPPMFHVRLLQPVIWGIATDPELGLDVVRLVHGEHDATFHRPLKHWDLVQMRGRLESVEEKSSGLLVTSRLTCFVEGEVAVEARTAFFIRVEKRGDRSSTPAAPPAAPPPPTFTRNLKVAPDQSYRYAEASLDRNPIHIDPAMARAAGLPDVILHGLCTMALSGKAVTDVLASGDPRFLRRLSVRFARPVSNGSTLTLSGWRKRSSADFMVQDEQGNAVITHGVAEFRT